MKTYDVLIIGGGICGMTAAIYAARANLRTCILEKDVCGGLVNWTNTVENVPSYPSIHGETLMDQCRAHVDSLGVDIEEVDAVVSVDFSGPAKRVTTSEGAAFAGKTVIVATGRRPTPLPVETAFPKVHYCSVCDGAAYKNKDVLVLGGGNSGFDEALFLAGLGVNSIHIVEVFPQCIAAASTQEKARACGKIKVSTSTRIARVDALPNGRGRVHLDDANRNATYLEEIDGIFCFIGQTPNTILFKGILELKEGYIKTNPDMETNIPGVFAAGDVIAKKYRQITTAMADGTIAALQAERYIRG